MNSYPAIMNSPSNKPLKCFDAQSYTIHDGLEEVRCIAPTAEGERCKRSVGRLTLGTVRQIRLDVCTASKDEERLTAARDLVLHLCCNRSHRDKLSGDDDCLTQVAERFLEHFRELSLLPKTGTSTSEIARRTRASEQRSGSCEETAGDLVAPKPPMTIERYSRRPSDTIESAMRKGPGKLSNTGYLYAFESESLHGRFENLRKIGFSRRQGRPTGWEKCMPGLKVVIEIEFPFPQRFERFIHLELHDKRREVRNCSSCDRTHTELFECTAAEVCSTIRAWHDIAQREPLFDMDGGLKTVWVDRLRKVDGLVTARKLLNVCELEDIAVPSSIKTESTTPARAFSTVPSTALSRQTATPVRRMQRAEDAREEGSASVRQRVGSPAKQLWAWALLRMRELMLQKKRKEIEKTVSLVRGGLLYACRGRDTSWLAV